ncbi:hypothetical protein KPZU09_21930 [Klebsiella pneumoniae]|uniref:Lipoprotein n=1 Tax=Klebsiella pneumoniae TaxID=573 RepID=A0A919HTE8_KLEPN|nr:hypothetical protein KPZU09_21930 [Klebsiella pneumoniae]
MVTRALLLLCLTLSAAACKNAPPAPIIQQVREPVPESLTEETPRPALDKPDTGRGGDIQRQADGCA